MQSTIDRNGAKVAGQVQRANTEVASLREQMHVRVTRNLLAGKFNGLKAEAYNTYIDALNADAVRELADQLGIVAKGIPTVVPGKPEKVRVAVATTVSI